MVRRASSESDSLLLSSSSNTNGSVSSSPAKSKSGNMAERRCASSGAPDTMMSALQTGGNTASGAAHSCERGFRRRWRLRGWPVDTWCSTTWTSANPTRSSACGSDGDSAKVPRGRRHGAIAAPSRRGPSRALRRPRTTGIAGPDAKIPPRRHSGKLHESPTPSGTTRYRRMAGKTSAPVSYTHLTLPTN